jgi:hypothetical protein
MILQVPRWRVTINYSVLNVNKLMNTQVSEYESMTLEVYTQTNFASDAVAFASKISVQGIITGVHIEQMDGVLQVIDK